MRELLTVMDCRPRMTRQQHAESEPEPVSLFLHFDDTRQVGTESIGRHNNPIYEITGCEVANNSGSDVRVNLDAHEWTVPAGETVTHTFSDPKPRTPGCTVSLSRGMRRG